VDETDDLKSLFFDEASEQLDDLEAQLAGLAAAPEDLERLHAAFRAVHSIKGAATLVGFDRIVNFAHRFESLLHRLRSRQLVVDESMVALLLRGRDTLHDLVRAAGAGSEPPSGVESGILGEIDAHLARAEGTGVARPARALPAPRLLHLRFSPAADYLTRGEPQRLFAELRRLGRLSVSGDASALPALDGLDVGRMHLRWTMQLETAAPLDDVRAILERSARSDEFEVIERDVEGNTEAAAEAVEPSADSIASLRGIDAEVQAPLVSSIRVDLDRMDRLVNLVGELVISQAMLAEHLQRMPTGQFPELARGIEELSRHARSLQEGVMAMRAQPVQSVFSRMPRLVRELAAQTGKRLRLETSGEDTEIDKTVIEHLHDPITHMIRNAADHGIESPAEREAAGKPETGTIRISAHHGGGRIVIQVADDGRGIDRDRLRARAVEAGLIGADDALGDEQIDDLIFLPGISTASEVSKISGRGVGMDVVRRNIQRLGGRVTIRSVPGQGSAFYLTLPLTLAVMDGMVVRVGTETYVVPLNNVIESLRPRPQDVHMLVGGEDVLSVRGHYVPLVYLHETFGVADALGSAVSGLVMLVETDSGRRIGLVVDEIVGQQQVVIKSLEANYRAIRGVAGATILGSGRVALILDVSGLHKEASGPGAPPMQMAGAAAQGEQL
jgi:two-component system chemotaxis sensor kinase CheA